VYNVEGIGLSGMVPSFANAGPAWIVLGAKEQGIHGGKQNARWPGLEPHDFPDVVGKILWMKGGET
jgi:hypothetical protein